VSVTPDQASRILVVQSGFLGDVVLTTPLLGALRRRFRDAELTMLVTPAAAPLVARHPALDRVVADDKRGRGRGAAGLLALARRLRAGGFTLAIAAHKSLRTGLALAGAGIPRRIGFAGAPGALFYTERVARPAALHDRDRLLELLRPLDAVPDGAEARRPSIALDAATWGRAKELLAPLAAAGRPLAGICPGSAWRTKRWPARQYGALVRRLEADGFRCVLLGAPEERAITAAVRAAAGGRGLDLAGATDVGVMAAVLGRMAVVVTNDSAPMHVATAVGVPQVAVFCATVPAQGYGPLGARALVVERDLACRPCGRHGGSRCPRGTDDCMELIEVAEVYAAVARVRRLAA
jgi:lipopolysaccharide heptosyltransferase II